MADQTGTNQANAGPVQFSTPDPIAQELEQIRLQLTDTQTLLKQVAGSVVATGQAIAGLQRSIQAAGPLPTLPGFPPIGPQQPQFPTLPGATTASPLGALTPLLAALPPQYQALGGFLLDLLSNHAQQSGVR